MWQSIFRQYVDDETWARLNDGFRAAISDVAWVAMEPVSESDGDGRHTVEVTVRSNPRMAPMRLALCGDHGPPIEWQAAP